MTSTPNGTIKEVDYLDGFQYAGGILQFFPTAEGYVSATESNSLLNPYIYNYVYNYTDHLGNIRMSYTQDPTVAINDPLEIMEENHYYPFGLKHSVYTGGIKQKYQLVEEEQELARPGYVYETDYQYKYQGQEYQDELGLNWYSFKWRNYDPAIGRFFNIDPLAEQYSYQSPYNFAENRVIDGRELEGLEWVKSTTGDQVHFDVKVQIVNTAGLSENRINNLAEKLQSDFNETYSQVDGYSASMTYEIVDVATSDYTVEVVDQIVAPTTVVDGNGNEGVRYVAGKAGKFGDTQKNNVKITSKDAEGNNRTIGDISKNAQHEIGHTAGLAHPWEKNANMPSDIDQKTGNVSNGTIRKNLMNSDDNPNSSLGSTSGTKLTPGQMKKIENTIDKNLGN